MSTIGERIKAERKRLGLNQEALATAGGVQRRTQTNYESDERSPDAAYLIAIAAAGVDVLYVLTGQPGGATLAHDEAQLLQHYRQIPAQLKPAALGSVAAVAAASAGTAGAAPPGTAATQVQQNFKGDVGQSNTGDITITGNTDFTFGINKQKK
ncbi:Transcriptional regulator, contains XRE-family HTH domain [Andreprevotia lacus DSM 23236]|jgi:transcriptional regulator with XRE-family HTH domain|uniref:Transcriptional regulator, contains XRE-family HTH domain n=1 Tax=Andreprevotia lacus DSM 23236 TaxID=1121001 RepID=A0A1W1XJV3_9NEIS|nr:helix-turn-helix transcriptional regulator [Andreprevotia lacus]SMC24266.1 Transcriptional regulator, contains XRE-family HTH domain [Andreprevotia lacus DSM 23236]